MKRRDFHKSTTAVSGGSITKLHKTAAQRGADPVPTGKLWRIGRTGRAALLEALLLGVFLATWTAAAQAQSARRASSTPTSSPDRGKVWLNIWAFTDAPVVGADVSVSVHGHLLVDAKAATNDRGVFPAPVLRPSILGAETAADTNARSFLRISISGGRTNGNPFLGHMMADVVLTNPAHQILVVNPVTTLVSLVLDARPNLKLDDAEALVRRFLGLPVNYSLGLALRQGPHYVSPFFSAVAFMTEVQDAGGLDAFLHLLLQELLASDSATHSFRQPALLGDTNSTIDSNMGKASMQNSQTNALGSTTSTATADVQAGLEAGALDYAGANNVANLTGWAMSLTGLTAGSSSDISTLQNELADLQSEIDNLYNEMQQLTNLVQSTATQTQYDEITNQAQPLATTVTSYEQDIANFAQNCPPLADDTTQQTNPNQSWCNQWAPVYANELATSYEDKDYEVLEDYIEDNSTLGTEGMLHLYSLWLGESRSFWRAADSTKMQNLYDYWDSVLTSAANLRMEYFHQQNCSGNPPQCNSAGQQQIISFMGNPDPFVTSFRANPTSITTTSVTTGSGYSTLSWAVTGSTSVSIDNGIGSVAASGTKNVYPVATTIYTLTATNASGSTTAKVTVGIGGSTNSPHITSFTATPASVTQGTAALLSWTTTGSTSQSINQGVGSVAASGTQSVSPTDSTTYTLTVLNSVGADTATVTVSVTPTFQANETANKKLMLTALTNANIVVSTVDHLMWALNPWQGVGSDTYQIAPGCGVTSSPGVVTTTSEGYAGFYNWSGDPPTQTQWQAAVQNAPPLSSGTDWQTWLISQTETTSGETPTSAGFYNMQSCHFAAWSITICASSSVNSYNVILTDQDSWVCKASYGSDNNFNWPTRPLQGSEQYFWYQ